jgi:hypothetical protein
MVKSSPEKLAAALRANLKRRKQAGLVQASKPLAEPPAEPEAKAGKKPAKNRD